MFSVMSTLLNAPLPDAIRRKKEEEDRRIAGELFPSLSGVQADILGLAKKDDSPPFLYLLTPNQMIENDYRLPSYISPGERVIIPGLKESDLPEALQKPGGAENDKGTDDLVDPPKVQTGKAVVNGSSGWPETTEATGPPEGGRYPVLAIDCEMVCSNEPLV